MIIVENLSGKNTKQIPFWFMRQAGRYLPEYKKIRSGFSNFLEFCYNPEAVCEVTIQPLTRFGMSAAIIFSDILVIPDALGIKVEFIENEGPVLENFGDFSDSENSKTNSRLSTLEKISKDNIKEKLSPVYKAIAMVRNDLPKEKALIGFCGSPWTLACYILQGKSSRDFSKTRELAIKNPESFRRLINILIKSVVEHACFQIKSGVDVIQLFDSWSGILSESEFKEYVIYPTEKIVSLIRSIHPEIKIIGFPRMCGAKLKSYAKKTGVDAVSFDGSVNLSYISNEVEKYAVPQGNLDSMILSKDKNLALKETKKIIEHFENRAFIFNLAHGILPDTPIDNVQAVSDMIQSVS